ncbi:MAG TPA: type II toxin-antitoxin system VapC family toxin [Solirubrobacterales bacterium]|nr:type II toxin-antitoxin system VapC family toxin [Solirubrobacterales bacterium]HNF82582.1 type II toxin-antitoxin system VapC family toxin [Solirubrobacterales bacterium]
MLVFDSSALLKRYLNEEHSDWVANLMGEDSFWAGSALLATETAIAVGRGVGDSADLALIDTRLNRDLEFFDLVPIDADCLVRAVRIGRGYGVKTLDAIHLAAASALPGEFSFVTFDDRQREAAEDLGLKVLTPPV